MGDFGACWDGGKQDKYIQEWHENKNYTTLSVAGNHENYDILLSLPIVEKWGGMVYQVTPHVFYTITGEVYNIAGYRCLAINGADSHDMEIRKAGVNWWADERISHEAIVKAKFKLYEYDNKIDFLFAHTGGSYNTIMISPNFKPSPSDRELDEILRVAEFRRFYFGHYHQDRWLREDCHCLYNSVYEIIEGKERIIRGNF